MIKFWHLFGLILTTLRFLKELHHIFFDDLNDSESVEKPKNTSLLRKKNTRGVILKQKGTRIAEDGEDWNGLEMTIFKTLGQFVFSKFKNKEVVPLNPRSKGCGVALKSKCGSP